MSNDLVKNRRLLLAGGGGALLALPASAARPTTPRVASPIPRARFTIATDFVLPKAETVTQLPLSVTSMHESNDFSLQAGGRVLINTSGQYRVILGVDWVAQNDTDIDRRMIGIRRWPGALPNNDDRLASVDIPGSNPPFMARYQGEWTPGLVPLGGVVSTEVTVGPVGVAKVGDMAVVGHTRIRDDVLGSEAVNALILQARVVAADRVRVTLYNPTVAAGVHVPVGVLNVIAMNATETRGESNDGWQVLHTATETLEAGQLIYAVVRSRSTGDYVQATKTTFMQIERFT
jgi:hypothetical protein